MLCTLSVAQQCIRQLYRHLVTIAAPNIHLVKIQQVYLCSTSEPYYFYVVYLQCDPFHSWFLRDLCHFWCNACVYTHFHHATSSINWYSDNSACFHWCKTLSLLLNTAFQLKESTTNSTIQQFGQLSETNWPSMGELNSWLFIVSLPNLERQANHM